MAGRGPPPKPNDERRRSNAPTFGWTLLAEQSRRRPPPLPDWREWHPATVQWWNVLWSQPQAAAWQRSGVTLAPAALVFQALMTGEGPTTALSAELRQHLDRHGLNPRSLLALRWRVTESVLEAPAPDPVELDTARRRRLKRQMDSAG